MLPTIRGMAVATSAAEQRGATFASHRPAGSRQAIFARYAATVSGAPS